MNKTQKTMKGGEKMGAPARDVGIQERIHSWIPTGIFSPSLCPNLSAEVLNSEIPGNGEEKKKGENQ